MKRGGNYSPHQLRRIISLDKIRSQKSNQPYTSPQRKTGRRKVRKTPRKRARKKKRVLGEWRLTDLENKILQVHIFPFVDVFSIVKNVCLVCVKFNELSMKTLNGRKIQDTQVIDFLLYHKPCDKLLFRLVHYKTIDCEYDPSHVFHFAVKYNRVNTVQYLIEKKLVDPSNWKNYAIQTASECGHLRIVRLLLKDDRVDPSVRDNYSLRSAWYNGHIEIVKCLLKDRKIKIGKDLGYIPDYIEMMKRKGSEIVDLMDSEDRIRTKMKKREKKVKNVRHFKKSPLKGVFGDPRSKLNGSKRKRSSKKKKLPLQSQQQQQQQREQIRRRQQQQQQQKGLTEQEQVQDTLGVSENKKMPKLSPITHRSFRSPVNPKSRENLESIRDLEDDSDEEEDEKYSRTKGNLSLDQSQFFERRIKELENFAKEILFKKHDLSGALSDSSFGEQFEDLEKLREESGILKRRILNLERSVSKKEEVSEVIIGKVRKAHAKRKTWKNILLTVIVSWILVFLTFLVMDFFFPVQLYHGFFPT